jgi:hypothetical protein
VDAVRSRYNQERQVVTAEVFRVVARRKKVREVVAEPQEQVVEVAPVEAVEAVVVEEAIVVVEEAGDLLAEEPTELSEEEQQERERLEKQIVNSFYQAGVALRELRDKKLFRSTHSTFEEYARDILGFSRIRLYQLMGAAQVYENIRENVNAPLTLLPTTEYQCRPLVKLSEREQVRAWKLAVKESGEKAPTSNMVKQAVLEVQQRATKREPNPFAVGDIARIRVKDNPHLVGQGGHLAVVQEIRSFNCIVDTALGERLVNSQHLEPAGLKPEVEDETRQLVRRLARLHEQRRDEALVVHLLKFYATEARLTVNEEEVLEVLERQGKSITKGDKGTEESETEG